MAFPKQYAPITFLNTIFASSNVAPGSTSFSTNNQNTHRGSWLISLFSNGAAGASLNITSISDTAGNTWVKGGEFADSTTGVNSSIWYARSIVGGVDNITATTSSALPADYSWIILEVSGLYLPGPFWTTSTSSSVLNMTMLGNAIRGPAFIATLFGCGNLWSSAGAGWYDYTLGGDIAGNGGVCKITNGPGPVVPVGIQAAPAGVFSAIAMAFYGAPTPRTKKLPMFVPASGGVFEEDPGFWTPTTPPPLPLILAGPEELPTSFPGFVEEWGFMRPPDPVVWASSMLAVDEEWVQKLTTEEDVPPLLGWVTPVGTIPFTYDEEFVPSAPGEEIAPPLVVWIGPGSIFAFPYDEERAVLAATSFEEYAPIVVVPVVNAQSAPFTDEEFLVFVPPPANTTIVDAIGLGHYIGLGHV